MSLPYLPDVSEAVEKIIRPDGRGFNASAGENYQKIFGRDTGYIGSELIQSYPEEVRGAILTLAQLQGVKEDARSEESPGKIHHECMEAESKTTSLWGRYVKQNLTFWSGGQTRGDYITYFSADATPKYISLVCKYAAQCDKNILDETIVRQDGTIVDIYSSVRQSAEWLVSNVDKDGLVRVPRRNRFGNFFSQGQGWKDSPTAYIHPDGSLVNISGRFAIPELQAQSYDALNDLAALSRSEDADRYTRTSSVIREALLNMMWNEQDQFFVSCLEQCKNGEMESVKTFESSAGRLLNSSVFDDLSEREKEKYISGVTRRLFSDDFLCDAGIRSRALRYKNSLNLADYHGSLTSWPVDTYEIAKGLRRQGLPKLAEQLESRVVNTVSMAGTYREFFIVREDGTPLVDYESPKTGKDGCYDVQLVPERDQGWTITAILAMKKNSYAISRIRSQDWRDALEKEILRSIKLVPIYETKEALFENRPDRQDVRLRVGRGLGKTTLKILQSTICQTFFSAACS